MVNRGGFNSDYSLRGACRIKAPRKTLWFRQGPPEVLNSRCAESGRVFTRRT